MHGHGMMPMGSMMWSWIFLVLLILGIVLIVVAAGTLLRGRSRASGATEPAPTRARELLDERYARGELSTDEYDERRSRLEHR